MLGWVCSVEGEGLEDEEDKDTRRSSKKRPARRAKPVCEEAVIESELIRLMTEKQKESQSQRVVVGRTRQLRVAAEPIKCPAQFRKAMAGKAPALSAQLLSRKQQVTTI